MLTTDSRDQTNVSSDNTNQLSLRPNGAYN